MLQYGKAATSDFLSIAEIDRLAWGSAPEDQFIPDGEHAWRLWVEYAFVHRCTLDGRVVGASLAFPALPEQFGHLLAVHKLIVHPDFRNKGIGTKLFATLFQESDRLHYDCFLTVKPSNAAAIAVYEKMGFVKSREIKGYYRENEDRLFMLRKYQAPRLKE